jgi:hypothetical protein
MMTIQIDFWELLTGVGALALTFLGFVFAAGKVLLVQIERRLEARFAVLDRAAADLDRLEKDFLNWKAELPMRYVFREDYVRNQTVIEAKLDALAVRMDNLRGRTV